MTQNTQTDAADPMEDEVLPLEIPKVSAADKFPVEEHWRMPWQEFRVALGVDSAMNQRNLNISTAERAESFFRSCGFDLTRSAHRKTVEQFMGEALYFIRHVLLTEEERTSIRVPRELLTLSDARQLVMMASERVPRRRYRRLWACATLKVMHAIASLEYSGRIRQIDHAREQIFGRIKKCLVLDEGKLHFHNNGEQVHLVQVDWKEAKTRSSILLKLLHKPDSIVDEVFDFLGVRFVVGRESEIPQLLKLLVHSDVIIPHQVLGFRTRNALINLEKVRRLLEFLSDLLSTDTITPAEFTEMCHRLEWSYTPNDSNKKSTNTFSSSFYRSLQLTVRHLVRSPNPAYLVVDSLNRQARRFRGIDHEDALVASLVPQEIAHYFPLEIQIMDVDSYDLSRFGPASHEQYKGNQLKTVRERVLGSILKMNPEKMAAQEF